MSISINGTNGLTFNDASTQNTAATGFGFKNRIINGAMAVNQRGTQTGSPLAGYTLDRWLFSRSGAGNSTVSQAGTTGFGGLYALSISSAHAAGEVFGIEQRIEAANSYDLAGKTATVQFWANASTSAGALGTFSVALSYANATDNFSSATSIGSVTFTPTSTPTLFTATFSVPSAATTGLKLIFSGGQTVATGTIQFGLGGVQLEKGSTATSFDYRPYGTELALCQRYYTQLKFGCTGVFGSATSGNFSAQFPVQMRAAPTYGQTGVIVADNFYSVTSTQSSTSTTLLSADVSGGTFRLANFSGFTAGQPSQLAPSNTNYVTVSAEL